MSHPDIDTALDWRGRTVVDRDGEKIGRFEELYLDNDDQPAWAAVNTGLFGLRRSFVPLQGAERADDDIRIPYAKDQVKDAPNVDPEEQLSPDEEDRLYDHYGIADGEGHAMAAGRDDVGEAASGAAAPRRDEETVRRDEETVRRDEETVRRDEETVRRDDEAVRADDAAVRRDDEAVRADDAAVRRDDEAVRADDEAVRAEARDTDAAREGTDDAMTRSEEEIHVGTRRRVRGKARLRKYVVTEHVQRTIPVQREEVRVEFEPSEGEDAAADADRDERGRDPR